MVKQNDVPGTLDLIIEELGQCGKYNIMVYVTIVVPIFFAGMYGSGYVFIAGDVDYRCRISECENLPNSEWLKWAIPDGSMHSCMRYDSPYLAANITDQDLMCSADWFDNETISKCDTLVYSGENTIVKDFNLGCQEWKRTLVGTIHNAGFFISLSLTGLFSDRFGRKTALATASLLNGVAGLLRSFAVNYEMFLVFEFIETALGGGLYTSAFILMMELVSPKNRVMMNSIMSVVFSLGLVSLAGLSWLTPDWRVLLRIMYVPAISFVVYLWILDESVRWLLSRGRPHDAVKIIKKAAKSNKVTVSDELLRRLYEFSPEPKENEEVSMNMIKKNINAEEYEQPKERSKLRQIFSSPIIVKRVLFCSFLWITCTFNYYGLSINAVSLSGNKYFNYIFVCFIEIPSHLSAICIVNRLGRRRTLIMTFTLAGIACTSLAFIPEHLSYLSLTLYLCGKFATTLSYNSLYLYISEVFPTSLRQTLLGFTSTLGRFGSLVAPQVPLMAYYWKSLPSLLFGLMALCSAVLSISLPETTNMKLPDTIEEAENISKRNNS